MQKRCNPTDCTVFCNTVGVTGFEPATTWSQTRCATGLRYAPKGLAKLASFAESLKILEEIFSRKYFRTSFPV